MGRGGLVSVIIGGLLGGLVLVTTASLWSFIFHDKFFEYSKKFKFFRDIFCFNIKYHIMRSKKSSFSNQRSHTQNRDLLKSQIAQYR